MEYTATWIIGSVIAAIACAADRALLSARGLRARVPLVLLGGVLLFHMLIPGNQWDGDFFVGLAAIGGFALLLTTGEAAALAMVHRYRRDAAAKALHLQFGVRFLWWMVLPLSSAVAARSIVNWRLEPLLREVAVGLAPIGMITGGVALACSVALIALVGRKRPRAAAAHAKTQEIAKNLAK